ncbi:MAG: ABC transporter substrate-binding protein [Chloroflexi bacterium]|nr:ABC transporter substrate-binding protein [Chloroflexota bacterium]
MVQRLSRRRFLLLSGTTISAIALTTACQSQAVPLPPAGAQPTTAPKPAEQKPAAAGAPAQSAPAGQSAPAAQAPAQAAPPAPAAQPAAAQPPAPAAGGDAPASGVNRKETVIMSVSDDLNQFADPEIFNPFLTGAKRTGWHFAYEPLYFYNPWFTKEVTAPPGLQGKDGEIPYLATGYEYSKDYTELTLKLRPGVTWSDGKPFQASDVVFTLNMLRENAPKLVFASDMKLWIKDVTAPDPQTAKITFNMPAPRFMFQYIQWHQDAGFPIVPEHVFKGQDPLTFTNLDLAKGPPVVTGPWKLTSSTPGQKIFERRDDWWGVKAGFSKLPAVKKVIVLPHYEDPKLTQLLAADQVTATHNIQQPADAEVILQRNLNILVRSADKVKPWGWLDWYTNCLSFNCMKAPFDDPEVRWAVNYAIDRKSIVDIGFKGDTEATLLPFPTYQPMIPYFDAVKDLLQKYPVGTYDPSKTDQIMESKGYKRDSEKLWVKDGQRISTIIILPPGFFQNFAPLIVTQLRDAGFDASFKSPSNAATLMQTGDLDAFIQGHTGSITDPYQTLDHYNARWVKPIGEVAERPYRWSNKEFSDLVDKMGAMHPSNSAFMDTYRQAMEIWLKNLPDVPTIQWYLILPVSGTDWKGWPDSKTPYCAPSLWHRGSAGLVLNTIQPA